MGEYADMEIERGMSNWIDYKTRSGIYEDHDNHEDFFSEWDGEEIPIGLSEKLDIFGFLRIKRETAKAWLLVMNGNAELWFPKKHCKIKIKDNLNLILIPRWLRDKIAGW